MRLFIAILPSDEMKDALIQIQNEMYDHDIRGYYAKEENLHLTLAFIGEYPDPDAVMDVLSTIDFSPFEIELDQLGTFDDLWWVGLKESESLSMLVQKIRRALANAGIPYDRKSFLPHVTLIRKASGELSYIPIEQASMEVNTISLMRSDRGKNGMIYTEIDTWEAEEYPDQNSNIKQTV